MLSEETLAGSRPDALVDLKTRLTTFRTRGASEMVTQGPLPFYSTCAHHLLPFMGNFWVGYIPNDKLVGLSKFARVIDHFARRLQMQEHLTTEVADFLNALLAPKAVIVLCEARHMCMEVRGVGVAGALTKTSALRGLAMSDPAVRSEFYTLISCR